MASSFLVSFSREMTVEATLLDIWIIVLNSSRNSQPALVLDYLSGNDTKTLNLIS